jgi:hypothetical protein
MRLRVLFSMLVRGTAGCAIVNLVEGGVGGLTGPMRRVCITALPFGFAKTSSGLSGLFLWGIALWAANGVCVASCELRRLLAVGGVAGLRLLCMEVFSRPDDRLLNAVVGAARLSRFGGRSCICGNLLLYRWLVGLAFSFTADF